MNALSVIMPCHNRVYDLERVLRAYDTQTSAEPFEVIAVDDASTDSTYSLLCSYHPNRYTLRVLRQEQNSGQGAARNSALPLADAPLVAFVGDDILPSPGLVAGHLAAHRRWPGETVAILGQIRWPDDLPCNTLMRHIDGVGAQQFSFHYLHSGQEYDFRHFYTSNVSARTAFLRSAGEGFDTAFHLYGYEDVEFAYRLRQRGLRIIYDAGITAFHYHYHTLRTFARRQYNSGLMALVLFRKHPDLLKQVRTHGWRTLSFLRQSGDWLRSPVASRASAILGGRQSGPKATADTPYRGRALAGGDEASLAGLEETALRLGGFYENLPNDLLDALYVRLLGYFEKKGLLDAAYGQTRMAAGIRLWHARRTLPPAVRTHVKKALAAGVPLPPGFGSASGQRLSVR